MYRGLKSVGAAAVDEGMFPGSDTGFSVTDSLTTAGSSMVATGRGSPVTFFGDELD